MGRGSLFETAAAAAAVLRTRGWEVVLSGTRRQFLSHRFTSHHFSESGILFIFAESDRWVPQSHRITLHQAPHHVGPFNLSPSSSTSTPLTACLCPLFKLLEPFQLDAKSSFGSPCHGFGLRVKRERMSLCRLVILYPA